MRINRHNMIHIRMLRSEYEKMKKCAAYLNMPTARYIRQMSIQREIKRIDLEKANIVTRSISFIGNSLRQMQKVEEGSKYENELNELLERYEVLTANVKKRFKTLRPNKLF